MATQAAHLFQTGWNAGIIQYTQLKQTDILKDAFKTVNNILSTSTATYKEMISSSLCLQKLLFDEIIINNHPDAEEQLREVGNNISHIVKMLCM
jgi:hypothetical protein